MEKIDILEGKVDAIVEILPERIEKLEKQVKYLLGQVNLQIEINKNLTVRLNRHMNDIDFAHKE